MRLKRFKSEQPILQALDRSIRVDWRICHPSVVKSKQAIWALFIWLHLLNPLHLIQMYWWRLFVTLIPASLQHKRLYYLIHQRQSFQKRENMFYNNPRAHKHAIQGHFKDQMTTFYKLNHLLAYQKVIVAQIGDKIIGTKDCKILFSQDLYGLTWQWMIQSIHWKVGQWSSISREISYV